jgi:transcriptional regulator with XRE-family HTH domain
MHDGKRLDVLVKRYGVSQKDLAEKIGVSEGTVSGWTKSYDIPRERIKQVCEYFHIKIWQFDADDIDVINDLNLKNIPEEFLLISSKMYELPEEKRIKFLKLFLDLQDILLEK